MSTERPEVRYREWESSDGAGTIFDLDEVYTAFRYAQDNGLSVAELFDLFVFPSPGSISNMARKPYELPEKADPARGHRLQQANPWGNPKERGI